MELLQCLLGTSKTLFPRTIQSKQAQSLDPILLLPGVRKNEASPPWMLIYQSAPSPAESAPSNHPGREAGAPKLPCLRSLWGLNDPWGLGSGSICSPFSTINEANTRDLHSFCCFFYSGCQRGSFLLRSAFLACSIYNIQSPGALSSSAI